MSWWPGMAPGLFQSMSSGCLLASTIVLIGISRIRFAAARSWSLRSSRGCRGWSSECCPRASRWSSGPGDSPYGRHQRTTARAAGPKQWALLAHEHQRRHSHSDGWQAAGSELFRARYGNDGAPTFAATCSISASGGTRSAEKVPAAAGNPARLHIHGSLCTGQPRIDRRPRHRVSQG